MYRQLYEELYAEIEGCLRYEMYRQIYEELGRDRENPKVRDVQTAIKDRKSSTKRDEYITI